MWWAMKYLIALRYIKVDLKRNPEERHAEFILMKIRSLKLKQTVNG